jgi:hypothetical protein
VVVSATHLDEDSAEARSWKRIHELGFVDDPLSIVKRIEKSIFENIEKEGTKFGMMDTILSEKGRLDGSRDNNPSHSLPISFAYERAFPKVAEAVASIIGDR